MLKEIKESANYLKEQISTLPKIGIILGSGLGNMATEISVEHSISYSDIPNFPVSTVSGHSGKLIFGKIGNVSVVAMQGRFHFYEGYSMQKVVFPVRVMKFLGVKTLIVSNASGGVNKDFEIGDIMFIQDHINLFPDNPLRGENYDELGPRFPDMSEPYSIDLLRKAKAIAKARNINVQEGVYVGLTGPTYETPAEYNYVNIIGGDAVGMSTVPEVIIANHMGMNCFGVSVITDLGIKGKIVELSHDEVKEVAGKAEPKITLIIKQLIQEINE